MKVHDFKRKKQEGSKICMLTCYDYPSARIIADSQVDCILVGDSVAMVVHGYDNTLMATMDMMVLHTQAVARGAPNHFIVSDIPFLCHKISLAQTVENVKRLMQAGAHAIKIEGADPNTCETITHLVQAGVPIIGHLGLTPQSIHQLGGYRVQGKTKNQEAALMQQAQHLEQAGCSALVLECIPQLLAQTITQSLNIPTIGIGAGVHTDGQVLVWHDLLGLQSDINPRYVKIFAQGQDAFLKAINAYAQQVHKASFPTAEHAF